MMSDHAKRSGFNDKILPHFENLLQFSLALTKNGHDAARLMRITMMEAYQSWEESLPQENSKMWVYKILTIRFSKGFQQLELVRPLVSISEDKENNVDESLIKNNRFFPVKTADARKQLWLTSDDDDVNYFEALAGLPTVYRTPMILSYLEGFSNSEIANLAGVQPQAVEALLKQGRELLQVKFVSQLTKDCDCDHDHHNGNGNGHGKVTDEAVASIGRSPIWPVFSRKKLRYYSMKDIE